MNPTRPPLPCPHGFATAASCVTCMDEGPAAPPEIHQPPSVVCVFRARYDGDCPSCGFPIVAARDRICELTNGSYVHERCAA